MTGTAPPPGTVGAAGNHIIDVWHVDLGTDGWQMRSSVHVLSQDELARAEQFRFQVDLERFVTCRVALRLILADEIDTAPKTIRFRYGEHGKPQLQDVDSDLSFNLSHAGSRAVIAVNRQCDVGVDIEPLREVNDYQKLSRLVFSQHELNQLEQADDKNRAFLNGWTRKEAYVKALGTGFSEPLGGFSVSLDGRAVLLATGASGGSLSDWTLTELADPGYVVALAARVPDAVVRVRSRSSPCGRRHY